MEKMIWMEYNQRLYLFKVPAGLAFQQAYFNARAKLGAEADDITPWAEVNFRADGVAKVGLNKVGQKWKIS